MTHCDSDKPTEDPGELLRIGEFAKRAGTNLRTVRYYEELGLVQPSTRSSGGFRYYEEADLDRMAMIQRLTELGLSLQSVATLFQGVHEGVTDRATLVQRIRTALLHHHDLLQERIDRLQEQRQAIQQAIQRAESCGRCDMIPELGERYCDPCHHDGKPLPGPFKAFL